MDDERIRQLRDIVVLSREMLTHASGNDWEQLAELEADRRSLVMRCFQEPASQEDAPQLAVIIREILRLNQEITECVKARQEAVGSDMQNNKLGRTARAAYLGCAR
jgi:hypothetical protein